MGVTVLAFVAVFAFALGVLLPGEPGGLSLGGGRVAIVEIEGLISDAETVVLVTVVIVPKS